MVIEYTYMVSKVPYTDEYNVCTWMSFGEFRYKWCESI